MRRVLDRLCGALGGLTVALAIAFLLTPIGIAVMMSFDARSFLGAFPPQAFSWHWYQRFVDEPLYMHGLRNSLWLASLSTLVSVSLGVAAAIGLHKARFRGKQVLVSIFLAPLVVPAVVIGFGLLVTLSTLGIVSGAGKLLIAHSVITLPYVIRSVTATLATLGTSIEEAAMSLGASPWTVIRTVILPLCRPGIVVGSVLAFTVSFDDVSVGIFLADPESTTLPLALVSMMRSNFDLTIAAASTVMIAVSCVALLLVEWLLGVDRLFGTGPTTK
ncbi:ABC transporter permease [Pseudomonas sp. RIT-PI-AD]|uniref:ABC transporter permease n=1 Tax=Pseudomonas sp. RIT-PI-AD TaxID=3035294 RepID=UPI0021D89678|nr:ABC transporter permease [Pseudomonas sp. RIT-PI-AD]